MTIRRLVSSLCACLAQLCSTSKLDAAQLRVVATTDVAVPGAAAPFDGFGVVSLNNRGQVAFGARRIVNPFRMDSGGVWSEGNGNGLTMVDPPGIGHWNVVLSDLGVVSFTNGALMQGSSAENSRVVAAYGQAAPGLGAVNGAFSDFFYNTPSAFNNRNEIAFIAQAAGNNRLYLATPQDSLRLVASAGEQLTDGMRTWQVSGLSPAGLNDAGQLLFNARVQDDSSGMNSPYIASYLWSEANGLKRIAGSGDVIETDRGAIEVSEVYSQLNDGGQLGLLLNGSKLVVSSTTGYEVVAAVEDSIGGERIAYFTTGHAMSDGDVVVYGAAMSGGTAIPGQTRMLLKNAPGQPPTVVARSLTPAPAAPAGQVFSPVFGGVTINSHGQVAFSSTLVDAASGAISGRGIWAENSLGVLESIAQTGEFVDVDGGPGISLRQILEVDGPQSTPQFNDRGQVAFIATFSDSSQALLVSSPSVPEPTAAVAGIAGCVGLAFCRRPDNRAQAAFHVG